jgi:uncharacterized protein (DUF58 family)
VKFRINFARLNHILIPAMKADRDKIRSRLSVRALRPFFALHGMLSRDGRALAAIAVLVGAAGIDVLETQVHLFFAMFVGLIGASLALRWFYRTSGVEADVVALPRIVAGEPQLFSIHLENPTSRPALDLAIEGPFLPWDGKWLATPPHVIEVPAKGRTTVHVRARFSARGEHHLDSFSVAALVPLGLAQGPRIVTSECKFLVVPRPANVVSVSLGDAAARSPRAVRSTHRVGDDELVSVRPYRNGDPLKLLHARTWARTNIPHVKQHVVERSVDVAVVCLFNDKDEFLLEAAISLAAGAVIRLAEQDSGLDHLVLDARAHRIQPQRGRAASDYALGLLAKWKPDHGASEDAILDAIPSAPRILLLSQDARGESVATRLRVRGIAVLLIRVLDDDIVSSERCVRYGEIAKGAAIAL